MNWDAVAAIGEIAGSVAVVLTLVVLIRQVREGTNATRAATMESIGNRVQERLLIQATDERLAALHVRALAAKSLSEFSEVEQHQILFWYLSLFNQQQLSFAQSRLSATSNADVLFRRSGLVNQLKTPIVRECWERAKSGRFNLRPDFVAFVEAGLKQSQP
jgi:hypothetical protein